MVNNLVYQGVSSLENGMFSTPPERLGFKPTPKPEMGDNEPEYPDAKQEIEEGLHKLETLFETTVDKNFDKFEILVLRNVLCVPAELTEWIRLKHYEVRVCVLHRVKGLIKSRTCHNQFRRMAPLQRRYRCSGRR